MLVFLTHFQVEIIRINDIISNLLDVSCNSPCQLSAVAAGQLLAAIINKMKDGNNNGLILRL